MTNAQRFALDAAMATIASTHSPALTYAYGYARVARSLIASEPEEGKLSSAMRSQLLYVQSNLTHWRGAEARATKATIKEILNVG